MMSIEGHSNMHKHRILLAEEDSEHSRQIQEYLQRLHYSVEVYPSGLSALQRLQESDPPEMALLSSSMTQMTGLEIGLETG
jgi:CheY-like chemotaxis protein